MCKFASGNPLGIVLATHLPFYSLTNTVKKILIETAFIQEKFCGNVGQMQQDCKNLVKKKGKVVSRTVALSKNCIHLPFCL